MARPVHHLIQPYVTPGHVFPRGGRALFLQYMKYVSLAAKYRPQNFADVAGQDMIKAVLSRAAAEDHVAAGYLLCGTRGVGKTTIARIFAKALNCQHAPIAEPCNTCDQCKKITAGQHPDVIEIDGASNNSVEDVRNLRENIGYAPMEGRYKIYIIDEAHMLSKSAFNALLKTLEEPPKNVTFIFATTEVHQFPATILSRCQVFSFRHISEVGLITHLSKILKAENIPFEESALNIIAHRAAGSVRDSMSLLDQVLAYGKSLTTDTVRAVLGIAGQDTLTELFNALATQDCAAAALFCKKLGGSDVDIGFFVRELAEDFRTLFLLRQCGTPSLIGLGLSENELSFWSSLAPKFTSAFLHAAWQMILEARYGITHSPEPAAILELLVINLTLLPQLLAVDLACHDAQAISRDAKTTQPHEVASPHPTQAPVER